MSTVSIIWNNFKNQPDIWFFYGFLLTFTLSIRKVLFFYPINNQFNEYTGIYLYLSDIFLVLALVLWGITILRNKYNNLSRNSIPMFHARLDSQRTLIDPPWLGETGARRVEHSKALVVIPLILVIWSFLSIFWSDNQNIALFRSVKLFEFYLLYIYLIFRIIPSQNQCSTWNMIRDKRGTILRNIFKITVFLGVFHSIIGIWQFFVQRSVGLFWLKESLISSELPGIAKIILNGEKFIRSYGLFPHPNILGGFLVFSIIVTFLYYKIFHPIKDVSPQNQCSIPEPMFHMEHDTGQAWNMLRGRRGTSNGASTKHIKRQVQYANKLPQIFLIIQITALVLTFSKSAILGLIIAISYILWKMWKGIKNNQKLFHSRTNVPPQNQCSMWNMLRDKRGTCYGTNVEHLYKKTILIVIVLILLVFIAKPDIYTFFLKSANERLFYLNVSYGTFLANPLFGIGQGQFVASLLNFPNILDWQFQPVHNVYLLILNELGIIGIVLFLWFLLATFSNFVPYGTKLEFTWWNTYIYFKAIFLAVLFIMLFDHYLWDIQQGQVLLWISAGLLIISSKITEK